MATLTDIEASINADAALAGLVRLHVALRTATAEPSGKMFANWLLESQGLCSIAQSAWLEMGSEQAKGLARTLLTLDLAYSAPLLGARRAEWSASQLSASLDPHTSVFFASGTVEPGFKKWEPLGAATFEIALIGMDKVNAFVLLATAED